MALPAQNAVIPATRNEPTLQNNAAIPYGTSSEAWPANPLQATLTATGSLPNRPVVTGVPAGIPQYFEFPVTAAAAVVLTLPASGYIVGDVVKIISRATLANTVTVNDVAGPTINVMPVTANTATATKVRYLGNAVGVGGVSWQAC